MPAALRELPRRRFAPTLAAAAFALAYVIISPPSLDLAAHLLRAKLFDAEGFGLWNNWWYAGHDIPGYSVLFPPLAALLTPQIVAAISTVGTAALFEMLVHDRYGEDAWLGALWFGAGTATNLFTGRLTFAFGLLPAVGAALALSRRRPGLATGLAILTALASPVAALFAGLAGATYAVARYADGRRLLPAVAGLMVVVGALAPIGLLAIAFPEGGTEPFQFATLWPVLIVAAVAVASFPKHSYGLRAGAVLYALGCIGTYVVPTAVGSNAARLGELCAGPLAALLWCRTRPRTLVALALPLLFLQWQAPVRDVVTSAGDPSTNAGFYTPLLSFLERQPGPPFRIEIPFTKFHWETYEVAPHFPLARGWERQLDIKYNHLFYGGTLDATTYERWLHQMAVRFVAVSDASLDYSAVAETALIDHGLPYLHLVMRSRNWRVYAVANATPIVTGAAALTALGPNSVTMYARRPGRAIVRVHFTPYWALGTDSGCVYKDGQFTSLELRRPGPVKLVIRFSFGRIGASSPRCN